MIETDQALLSPLASAIAERLDVGGTPESVCAAVAEVLRDALRDDALQKLFDGHERSFEAWHDRERGFVLHASIHAPGHRTPAHDHAEAWAVYGTYRGANAYRLYRRDPDAAPGIASLRLIEERIAAPGEVAVVLPGQVHENWNPSDRTAWNLVIRPRPLAEVWRRRFDSRTGRYAPMRRGG